MDPAIVLFGLGIGVLVGMTGMGGGSLMTPLLILIFGISPTTAIGTDIFYAAVTKTVGGWRHLKMKTVNMDLVKWLALGSVPSAVGGVLLVSWMQTKIGEARLEELVYAVLGGTLLMVGVITLARALILRNLIDERDRFEVERRHKVAAVVIGAATTIDGTHFAVGTSGHILIGDCCYIDYAILLCEAEIRIGSYVVIGWNTTIADSDFHPLSPAERVADAIACSPLNAGVPRPRLTAEPVVIEDYAWIGPSSTIMKGVHVGAGAWIEPGSVITRDVPPGARMLGNPARQILGGA